MWNTCTSLCSTIYGGGNALICGHGFPNVSAYFFRAISRGSIEFDLAIVFFLENAGELRFIKLSRKEMGQEPKQNNTKPHTQL
jgi:hypothetical protein